jgi:hypothetical protein
MRRALPASLVVNNNYAISLKLPHLPHIANFHDNAYVSTISCVTAEVFLQSSNFMQEKIGRQTRFTAITDPFRS